ncbi:hypothetical protein, partial [Ornithinibacillus sp. JPR2-1]|uniref:hypothetical protein n=1 Tax=Ornithinibacillus sp. JPR2-1 TaxID=2094019 RepID=UPI0031CE5C8A
MPTKLLISQGIIYKKLLLKPNYLYKLLQVVLAFAGTPQLAPIKTTSVNWWFALRLEASITGLGLKGPPNSFPSAPHSLTDSK